MGTRTKKDYNDPLAIWNEMAGFDRKDYDYYDRLTDDQKKQFSPYLMLRWGSTVEGNNDISKYYAVASNEFVNADFWSIQKHKKLQWLLCCVVSPNVGKQKHYWLGTAKRESGSNLRKLLLDKLPNTKIDEIDLILKVKNTEEIIQWLKSFGLDEKTLKSL
jgi:hypothetical protein